MDFTLKKYQNLCEAALKNEYHIKTVSSYIQGEKKQAKVLIIRHDVDRLPKRALKMAVSENALGICSTYYFRKSDFGKRSLITSIATFNHEIGYHYETLDEARGNYAKAYSLFKEHLEDLRKFVPVQTVCMHGAPFTKWLNRDLWNEYDFHELDLLGEAFLSIKDVYYFSDTGRKWDMSQKIKDKLVGGLAIDTIGQKTIKTTDDIIGLINRGVSPIYITVHCERWSSNILAWAIDSSKDLSVNVLKSVYKMLR